MKPIYRYPHDERSVIGLVTRSVWEIVTTTLMFARWRASMKGSMQDGREREKEPGATEVLVIRQP
jgi:hypothetical protein